MKSMREVELEWELHKANRRIAELEGTKTYPLTWEDTEVKSTIVNTHDLPLVARVHYMHETQRERVRLETLNQPNNIQLGYYMDTRSCMTASHLKYMLVQMHEDLIHQIVRKEFKS